MVARTRPRRNMKKIWEGGVGAIKFQEKIIFIFLYQCPFEEMKNFMIEGIKTREAESKIKIYKKLTIEEVEQYEIINLFSIENSNTNIKFIDEKTLRWITYSFIQYFKPKYNEKGINKEYNITPNEISKGEQAVESWLIEHKIKYIKEFSYPDLKGDKNLLRFDFKIEQKDVVIEFQGEQHFRPVQDFGGEENFIKQIKYDNLKREYCGKNMIKLIEIPYNYKNLDFYLNSLLYI